MVVCDTLADHFARALAVEGRIPDAVFREGTGTGYATKGGRNYPSIRQFTVLWKIASVNSWR